MNTLLIASAALCSSTLPRGGGICETIKDCNGAGMCISKKCVCDDAWTGLQCGDINFGKAYRCGEGGACLQDNNLGIYSTWGGGVVVGEDKKFHMFAAGFRNNCPLSSWLTNSVVVHLTSDTPHGPYTAHDLAINSKGNNTELWDAITDHNPAPLKIAPRLYTIFYMGSNSHIDGIKNCNSTSDSRVSVSGGISCPNSDPLQNLPVCNQKIGIRYATTPYGPWKSFSSYILGPGPAGEFDDLFVTNPSAFKMKNGTVVLLYKGRSREKSSLMLTGVAVASSWNSTFTRYNPTHPISVATTCEDAGVYFSEKMQLFRLVFHCACNYQYAWSTDGLHWQVTTPQKPWCTVAFNNGTETFSRRERPQWFVDPEKGYPTHLFTGVMPTDSHNKQSWTFVQELA